MAVTAGPAVAPASPTVAAAAAASTTVVPSAPGVEARAALLRVPAPLLGGRPDLRQDQVVLRPLDRDLLADELLDPLEVERAGLVHEGDRLAARSRPRRAADAVDVVFR